jgi:hypothetical protein
VLPTKRIARRSGRAMLATRYITRTYLERLGYAERSGINTEVAETPSTQRSSKTGSFSSLLCVLCALAFFALFPGRNGLFNSFRF